MFFDGTETPNTLYNLVQWFRKSHGSHLAAAIAQDMELYEATHDPDRPAPKVRRAPEMAEVDLPTSIFMGIHELLQEIRWWTATNAPKGARRPKVRRFPRPKAAAQLYATKRAREDHAFIEDHLMFVPPAEFDRIVAEHKDKNGG